MKRSDLALLIGSIAAGWCLLRYGRHIAERVLLGVRCRNCGTPARTERQLLNLDDDLEPTRTLYQRKNGGEITRQDWRN